MEKLVTNVADPDDHLPRAELEALAQLSPRERDVSIDPKSSWEAAFLSTVQDR